jgi:transcriptional regulator with XRE-family HTH domain
MISNDIQKRLGDNLKRIRKSKNLTQFQLAEIADVSEETIKNIELCRCWTSDKNLAKITEALNIDISKLFLPVQSSIQEDSKNITQIKQTIAEELKSYIETKLNEIIR